MEIKTHVLTTEQHLEPNRKKRARKNIEAIGSIAVNGETVTPEAGEDSVDLSGYTVPTPSTANKVLTSGEDGSFDWQTPADPSNKADKVSEAIAGHLAELTQDGNLADSGINAADVATGAKIGPDGAVIQAVGGVIELPQGTAVNDGLLQITVGNTTVEFSANANNAEPKVVNIQSLEPAQGGTSVSLVTTGEKDNWNKKLDKVSGATQGNFAGLDSNGDLTDSGSKATDFATAAQGTKADTAYQKPLEGIPYNDLSQGVQHSLDLADSALQSHQDITGKADKVTGATQGNFAGLDSNGNLADSGSKAADFATAAQGEKADTAYQKPVDGVPYNDLSQGVQHSLDLADSALQSHQDITGKADKDIDATEGNLAKFDANGNPVDSDIAASAVALQTDIPSEYLKSATVSDVDKKLTIVKQDDTTLDFYGDVNKIEKVKVDGQELTIDQADKSVNVVLTGKADKVTGAVEGNFAGLDSNGNMTDSGSKAFDFATAAQGAKADTAYQKPVNGIPLNDLSSEVTDIIDGKAAKSEMDITPVAGDDTKKNIQLKSGLNQDVVVSHQDITGKADKVTSAVEGNFAGLDANGNIADSGSKASDFATAAQGTTADTAVQTIELNGTSLSGTSVDLGNLKTKQTAVLDPTSSGDTDSFIDSISQNANGEITATKKAVQTVIAEGTSGARNGLITKESQAKLDGIASGAQVNVLEGVKVAGTELEIVSKKVNIPLATVPSQGVSGTTGVVNLTSDLDSQDPNAAITPSAVAAALRAQAKFFDDQAAWNSFVHDNPVGDAGITYYVQVGSGADQYDVYRWKVPEGAEPGCYKKVDEASISLDGYWYDGPTVSGEGNVVTAISVAATGVPQVTKGLTVGDGTLTMTVGSANAKTFSANQTANETLTIPLAASASGATAATEGLMSSADKGKLDAITDAEYKNKIDAVKVNNSALTIDPSNKSVNIPLASYTTGVTPTYEDGVVSGQDKKKIDDAIQGVKLEGATDPIVPSNDRVVTIPNAVPTGTGETNGLLTAADKAKLDSFASVNDTTITIDVGGAASGESNPVAGDFTTNQDTAETITIPAAQSAIPAVPAVVDPDTGEITTQAQEAVPAQPGVMSAADKDKLDNLKIFKRIRITNNGSTVADIDADDADDTVMFDTGKGIDIIQVGSNSDKIQFATTVNNFDRIKVSDGATPTPTVVDVTADDVNQPLTLVAGDNIVLTPDNTNKSVTISSNIAADLGYIYGKATVINPASQDDLLNTSMTGYYTTPNNRFLVAEDQTDNHVYLYALKSSSLVNGVDMFSLNINSVLQRGQLSNGYYYYFTVRVINKSGNLIAESNQYYPSQVGESTVNMSLSIKNSDSSVTTIDGREYYAYRIVFAGDAVTSPDTMGIVTTISAIEETCGFVEITGGSTSLTPGDAINIANDTIDVKYGKGLGLDANNQLEVKAGAGLTYNSEGGITYITLDSVTEEVVNAVQKLNEDLDTKLTTNFSMPLITNKYDFADRSVNGIAAGAGMICQAFTVPINNQIRLGDSNSTEPTLFGIYATQAFDPNRKIMLALYVYDFETQSTDYVADTGPVTVVAGRNEYPIKHLNPNITELKSSCVYYATLYLPSASNNNGLYLVGCPSYSAASQINAIPRFTVGVDNITYNGSEISMASDDTGRLDYKDGNNNYYIGPWTSSYNEKPDVPRFFMQIRNAAGNYVIVTEPFTNIPVYTLGATNTINDVFGSIPTPSGDDVVFQEVRPYKDVYIKGWTFYDTKSGDTNNWGGRVYSSGFDTCLTASLPSGVSITATHSELSGSTGIYAHHYEFTGSSFDGIKLDAYNSYRFPAALAYDANDKLVQYTTPNTVKKTLHLFDDGADIRSSALFLRENNAVGTCITLTDKNGNSWTI